MKKVLLCLVLTAAFSCGRQSDPGFELTEGVSLELASHRKRQVSEVKYNLSFNIPEKREDSIPSRLILELSLKDPKHPLVLDFNSDKGNPGSGIVNGVSVPIGRSYAVPLRWSGKKRVRSRSTDSQNPTG